MRQGLAMVVHTGDRHKTPIHGACRDAAPNPARRLRSLVLLAWVWLLVCLQTNVATAQLEAGEAAPLPFLQPVGQLDGTGEHSGRAAAVDTIGLAGNVLYLIDNHGEVRFVDVSDPTQLYEVGRLGSTSPIQALTADGDWLYTGDQEGQIRIYDVADPTRPRQIASVSGSDLGSDAGLASITSLAVAEDLLLIAGESGLRVVDVSAPGSPQVVGFYAVDNLQRIAFISGSASVVALEHGAALDLIDLSDPGQPSRLEILDRFPAISAFATGDGMLYVVTNDTMRSMWRDSQVWIIDLTNSGAPALVAQESVLFQKQLAATGHSTRGALALVGTLLYLVTDYGLTVFDVSDPRRPVQINFQRTPTGQASHPLAQLYPGSNNIAFRRTDDGALTALRAQPPFVPRTSATFEFLGHLGGGTNALVAVGDLVYMSNGPEISVLDLSQPALPRRVGHFIDLEFDGTALDALLQFTSIEGLAVGDVLYVLETWQLRILDISNPTAPQEIVTLPHGEPPDEALATHPTTSRVRNDAVVQDAWRSGKVLTHAGSYLYLVVADCFRPGSHTVCEDFLRIVDVSDPAAPRVTADITLFDVHYELLGEEQIVAAGDRVYISTNQGVRIIDVSDPAQPVILDTQASGTLITGNRLAVEGERIYLTSWGGSLRVLDAADPAALATLSDISWTGGAGSILLHEEYLFVAGYEASRGESGFTEEYGWFVLARGADDTPVLLDFFPTDGEITAMTSTGDLLYLATASGLHVVDVSDPVHPERVGFYGAPSAMAELHVDAGVASIAGADSGLLSLVDVRQPNAPEVRGHLTNVKGSMVDHAGQTILVAANDRLQRIDMADPAALDGTGHLTAPGTIRGMTLHGPIAYLYWEDQRREEAGLLVVDVDQSSPAGTLVVQDELSLPYTSAYAARLIVAADMLYLFLRNVGLYTLNIANARAPRLVAGPYLYKGEDLVVGQRFAYLASYSSDVYDGYLSVLDLANPAQPHVQMQTGLGLLGISWQIRKMAVDERFVYLADQYIGLRAVDISVPAAPVDAGLATLPDVFRDIAVEDGTVYVTTYESGLFVYQIQTGARPALTALSPGPEAGYDGRIVGRRTDDGAVLLSTNGGADWSPWSPPVAFSAERDGNREIYVATGDGSNVRRLTAHPAADETPAWSPAWSHIVFASERSGNWDLYSVRVDCTPDRPQVALGCDLRQLTDDPAADLLPAWSPDGREIAFVSLRDGNAEIYVMHHDGTHQRRQTFDPAGDWRPAWLPNSRELVYTGGSLGSNDIFRLAVSPSDARDDAPAPVALVTGPADDRDPAIGDGHTLLFISDRDGFPRVFQMALDNGTALAPLAVTDTAEGHPAWTPNDQVLVARTTEGEAQIYLVENGTYLPLTPDSHYSGHPAAMPVWWIPDYGE